MRDTCDYGGDVGRYVNQSCENQRLSLSTQQTSDEVPVPPGAGFFWPLVPVPQIILRHRMRHRHRRYRYKNWTFSVFFLPSALVCQKNLKIMCF